MRILFALLLLSGVSLAQTGFTNSNLDNLNAAPAKANLLGIGMASGFADPNADRILFWDDSAGAYTPLTLGTNLSITGTTIDAAGGSTNLTYTASSRLLESSTGTDATLPLFTTGAAGLVPASGGGTTNFLRADGTFAAPPTGSGTFDEAGDYTLTGVWDYTGATATFGAFSATTLNATTFQIGGADITATAAELNLLDGVTATTAELNFVDGVTSAIQTQLDAKASNTGTLTGTHTAPSTTNPLAPTWTGPMHVVFYGATGEIDLPAAAGYAGRGIAVYNTGAFTVSIDPSGSEVIVRDGTVQTGGVTMTLSSGAGNFVTLLSDGTRWVTFGFKGTLGAGS